MSKFEAPLIINFPGMKTKIYHIVWVVIVLFFAQCQKDENISHEAKTGALQLRLSHSVDGQPLQFDTLLYKNASGTMYSVSQLHYYISDIIFSKNGGEQWKSDSIFYIDASQKISERTLLSVPDGKYTQMTFNIGLSEKHNKDGHLPGTLENLNMAWPTVMGGGYHFMKLEGYYADSSGSQFGYAMHLGTNAALTQHNPIVMSITITAGNTSTLNLSMNLNEWFTHPSRYDFKLDGNYTMSDTTLIKLISNNGKDVFSIH